MTTVVVGFPRLLEFTSRDDSGYHVLGGGKYDPFLMAVLGAYLG